ncbi:NitT/TauT family transport system permease protein [Plasticicumulans lactativorans]|uniref:NitT/TauT family transport system permease protein n=1 Tax=Plasticicumulans lactativorans TaxID=1133106 RepID=A0A4R2LF64_9GAMM|nr:ABC transporter permease subunit [Plasticicumulans lactativorans]TCO83397.1 NitT/TauT family transport system permease protein [Plasticicumulans lactativorans]
MPPVAAIDRALRPLSLLALLLLWQLAASAAPAATLPPPLAVGARLWVYTASGELPYHLGVTLARVAASFALALTLGTALGIALGAWPRLDRCCDAWLVVGLNIPALVTVILCYLWFGLNDVAAVLAVALNKIPTVVVTVREGARAADRALLDMARAFRLPRLRTFARVYLPQLYPYVFAAARGGLALIWKIVLVVELLGRSSGVGYQLSLLFQLFDIAGILAYTLAFAGVVLVVEGALLRPLERRLLGWRR